MPITTRSEYGLRAMILLAEQLGDELLSAAEIARRERIPVKYLEQILTELRKAGLVSSHAGARGGYQLARPARDLRVGEIVRVLDGSLAPMGCAGESPAPCDGQAECRLRPLWRRLEQAMSRVLDGTTLDQLAFGPSLERPPVEPGGPDSDGPRPDGPMYHI